MKKISSILFLFILINLLFIGCTDKAENIEIDGLEISTRATTVYFNNRNVTTNITVSGEIISTQSVTVTNGATLTFNPTQEITIYEPFTVDADCSFIIN